MFSAWSSVAAPVAGAFGRPHVDGAVPGAQCVSTRCVPDSPRSRLAEGCRGWNLRLPGDSPRHWPQILTMIVAVSLATGHPIVAGAVEGFMLAAVGAILFGGCCLGCPFVFHLLAGNGDSQGEHYQVEG